MKKLDKQQKAMIFVSVLSGITGIVGGSYIGYRLGNDKGFLEGCKTANKSLNSAIENGYVKMIDLETGEALKNIPFF